MAERKFVTRSFSTAGIETREEGGKAHISGVIPYDSLSEDLGGFREVIRKGAFTKTLQEGDARCLWAHNTQYVLGRRSANTLSFRDEADGLHFDCTLPATSWARDVFETVSRRDAPGVSFGFYVIKDAWTRGQGKEPSLRELLEVNMLEVSVGVAFPAYPASDSESSTRALFDKAGINIEKLASVLIRAEGKNDYICGEEDAATVREAVKVLSSFLPKEEHEARTEEGKPEESTCGKPGKTTFDSRAREIELLEAESENLREK